MINEHIGRDFEELTVHWKVTLFTIFVCNCSGSVESPAITAGTPFVFGQIIIIVGVNDGVFALCQRYSAEGIAVAKQPIQKHRQDGDFLKPVRDFDFENVLDDFLSPLIDDGRQMTDDREQQAFCFELQVTIYHLSVTSYQLPIPSIIGRTCTFESKKVLDS